MTSFVGRVPEPGELVFTLTPGTVTTCARNYLSLPLDHPEITNANQLADAIGTPSPPGPPTVIKALDWASTTQSYLTWNNANNSGNNFATTIGYPYVVCVNHTAPAHWPTSPTR